MKLSKNQINDIKTATFVTGYIATTVIIANKWQNAETCKICRSYTRDLVDIGFNETKILREISYSNTETANIADETIRLFERRINRQKKGKKAIALYSELYEYIMQLQNRNKALIHNINRANQIMNEG